MKTFWRAPILERDVIVSRPVAYTDNVAVVVVVVGWASFISDCKWTIAKRTRVLSTNARSSVRCLSVYLLVFVCMSVCTWTVVYVCVCYGQRPCIQLDQIRFVATVARRVLWITMNSVNVTKRVCVDRAIALFTEDVFNNAL